MTFKTKSAPFQRTLTIGGNITVRLTPLFDISKAAESDHTKQEVSGTLKTSHYICVLCPVSLKLLLTLSFILKSPLH